MTRKSIDKLVDAAIDQICEQTGLDPRIEAKGGEREVVNAEVYKRLRLALAGIVRESAQSIGPKDTTDALHVASTEEVAA